MQFYGFILDKVGILMVKYAQVNIAVNGKSTIANPIESLGHRLQARAVSAVGKCVRERIGFQVINKSGTADRFVLTRLLCSRHKRRFLLKLEESLCIFIIL